MLYEYEKIVIGCTLNAVLYAFVNKLPIIFTEYGAPFRFDYFEHDMDFSCLKIDSKLKKLKSFEDDLIVGISKRTVWDRMLFLMSLEGLVLPCKSINTIRHEDSRIIAYNEYAKIAEIKFESAFYFGDQGAHNFVLEKELDNKKFICYDWVAFNRGGKHEIDYFETSDGMVKKVWFYPSERIDGNTPVKDACVLSEIPHDKSHDFEFSETMVRFKLVHEMESRGMKGVLNGYTKNGTPRYYKFRTSSISRSKHSEKLEYKPKFKNIEIPQADQEDLLARLPHSCVGYDRFLKWL